MIPILTWLHIGDLHVTASDGENLADLRRIAKVPSDAAIRTVECQIGDAAWTPMTPVPGQAVLWQGPARSGGVIRVRAWDAQGRIDMDQVEPPGAGWTPPPRFADGSDRDSVGAWPAKGLLGTQLGPNRNGRKW